jgi:transposase
MYFIGWDVHKKKINGATLNSKGNILVESKFDHSIQGARSYLEGYPPEHTHIVMESSSHIYVLYDYLVERGYDVKIAHAKEMHRITKSSKKNDKRDALQLAKHLLANDIPESYIPSKEIRKRRSILRTRIEFMQERTRIKNKIQSILQIEGGILKTKTSFCKKWIKELKDIQFEQDIKHKIELYLIQLGHVTKIIDEYNDKISTLVEQDDKAKLVMTIPGFGELTSLILLTELGDYKRFQLIKQVAAYVGIIPSSRSSGERVRHGKICKDGNRYIKWALVQSANSAGKSRSAIGRYFRKRLIKKGYQKACVATAHKLLRIAIGVLRTNTPYSDSLVEVCG